MEREERYFVAKQSDIFCALNGTEGEIFETLAKKIRDYRQYHGKNPDKKYVVVSEDWPMYEDTWKAIEEWVDSNE